MNSSSPDDRFEIIGRLGSGSFGVVYEAFDRYRYRNVALKVLERALPDSVARFKREFRYLADIRHPNLISLYELLMLQERWAVSMELIRGSELLEHLVIAELQNSFMEARTVATEPQFDADETLRWRPKRRMRGVSPQYFELVRHTFRQLAVGVAVLHAHGILHRDIKPSNIMMSGGRVVLLDFGLVVEIEQDDSIDRDKMVGTPGYMAPELIAKSKASVASDWYSFGVLLYQALTGQMPFNANTPLEVLDMQVHQDPPPAVERLPGVPQDLASIADDCVQRDPALRPNVADVLRRLDIANFDAGRAERSRTRATHLIGRTRELRTLSSWIAETEPGTPQVIALHGPPGSGKTALLDLALDRARADNVFIAGGAVPIWESLPFNAIDVIVDSVARELRRVRNPAADDAISRAVAVTQIFPTLLPMRRTESIEETIALPATGEKLVARAATELRSILFAAAGDRPLLLVLDNAQWGDYQSAEVMRRLLIGQEGRKVVLMLVYTTDDWQSGLMMQSLVGMGLKMRDFMLKEFSRALTQQLIENSTGKRRVRSIDDAYRSTAGNAALIELAAEAIATRDDGRPLLARAIAARLQNLSASAYRLFLFLVMEGPCYEWESAAALELIELDEPIRTLRNERLIRVRKTGDLRALDIYHEQMRKVLRA